MKIEKEININVEWDGVKYEMNIAPIINALLAFLTKLMDAYLPKEFDEILGE